MREAIRSIMGVVRPAGDDPELLVEAAADARAPAMAGQFEEKFIRVQKAWNRAYPEFARARDIAYDTAATYGLRPGLPSTPKGARKEAPDVTREPVDSLVQSIRWVSDRFAEEYEREVAGKAVAIRNLARDLAWAAERARNLDDKPLKEAGRALVLAFLPFKSFLTNQVFRSVESVVRRSEALVDRFNPEASQMGRPPRGRGGKRSDGKPLGSPKELADAAKDMIEHLDTFVRLSSPTAGEIGKLAPLADGLAMELPQDQAEPRPKGPEPEEPAGDDELTEAKGRKRLLRRRRKKGEDWPEVPRQASRRWLELSWSDDPEIGGFF